MLGQGTVGAGHGAAAGDTWWRGMVLVPESWDVSDAYQIFSYIYHIYQIFSGIYQIYQIFSSSFENIYQIFSRIAKLYHI